MKYFHLERGDDPEEIAIVDRDEYVIDSIVSHRLNPRRKGKTTKQSYLYRVRWRGYDPNEDTWEEYKTIKDTEALELYLNDNSL